MLKISSINVNGIRAAGRKGIHEWLEKNCPDVLALQEVRADEATTAELLRGWNFQLHECQIKGRAGVAIAVPLGGRVRLESVTRSLSPEIYAAHPNEADGALNEETGEPLVDTGRWIEAQLRVNDANGAAEHVFTFISAYLHAGAVGTPRQDAKMAFLKRVEARLAQLSASGAPTLIVGDFNIVRSELDIKNWASNHNKSAGVLDEEIEFLNTWMGPASYAPSEGAGAAKLKEGAPAWVDVQRQLQKDTQGPYTWWSNRGQAFTNDAGWRIDYHMASPALAALARDFDIYRAPSYEARFTDHAPLTVNYEL